MARVVALVIAVLVLVPAASASQPTPVPQCDTVMNPGTRVGRAARSRDLDLTARYTTDGARVTWLLSVRNRARQSVWISFPTSQHADVIVRKGGRLEHRWSSRHGFFQAFTHRRLGPRETYVCRLEAGRLDLEPGRYELWAFLRSTVLVSTRRSLLVNG